MRLLLVTCISLITLLATACGDGDAASPASGTHGKEFPAATTPHIAIGHGERFSVVVPDNASVGDMWQLKTPPDTKIATADTEDHVADSPTGTVGGGGKRYFVFTAHQPGESAIELYDCFRGCQSADDKARSKTYEIHLSVT